MSDKDTIPTRGSLLARLREDQDPTAWVDFCETYRGLLKRLALAAGLRPEEAEDVVQEVFIGVHRGIGRFHYDPARCSFKHWLSQLVRWRIQDQMRRRIRNEALTLQDEVERADTLGGEVTGVPAPSTGSLLEAAWEAEWRRHLIELASARVKRQVSPKQFQVFFLHVLKDIPAQEVARRLRVTRGRVYLTKLRVGRLFRRHLESLNEDSG